MDSTKKAVEMIQDGYFGTICHWTSYGRSSVVISSVFNEDVLRETIIHGGYNINTDRFYALDDLVRGDEIVLINEELFDKIRKIVPEVAEKLAEVVAFLKPLAGTIKHK